LLIFGVEAVDVDVVVDVGVDVVDEADVVDADVDVGAGVVGVGVGVGVGVAGVVGAGCSLLEQNHQIFSFDCQLREIQHKSCEAKPIPLLQKSRVNT
jgi:hypothetical protein